MTTETKNTTAIERRIARRETLAAKLGEVARALETMGVSGQILKEAATELHIANVEAVVAGPWAGDGGKPGQVQQLGPDGRVQYVNAIADGIAAGLALNHNQKPTITDAMIDRAADGWEQYWNDYPVRNGNAQHRAALRFALERALGVGNV